MNNKMNTMYGVTCLLVSLSPEVADYDEMTEEEIICSLVQEYKGSSGISNILKEGAELLAMEPFPWEWVEEKMYTAFDGENDAKETLKLILNLLETEAKRQGKL